MEQSTHLRSPLQAGPEPDAAAREAVLERFARAVVARRLESAAVLFLELNRPLGFLFSQAALIARPFLSLFVSPADVEAAARLLDDPEALDRLLARIGELSAEPRGKHHGLA